MSKSSTRGRAAGLKPKRFFKIMEERAVTIRKQLRILDQELRASGLCGLVDDAVEVASCIEDLSVRGRTLSAEEAYDCAGIVQDLADFLAEQIVAILTSTNQRVRV